MEWRFDLPWSACELTKHGATVNVLVGLDGIAGSMVDVHIKLGDGRHCTGEFIAAVDLVRWFESHDEPYWTPNLVVIADATLDSIGLAVDHLLSTGDIENALHFYVDDE